MTIQSKKLSSFCRTGSGGTPSRSNSKFFENGTIPWVKSGELKNRYITSVEEYITELAVEKSSAKLVSKGSLLIAMYGATVGEVSQLTFDATTNQAICNIAPDENVCDVNYLYRFLEASKPYLLSRRVGGGQPNISQGIIKDLEVPLPSLSEQRRIASILDKADELRQKRQQAIEKLDQLLQATFLDMFGDFQINPMNWQTKPLSEVVNNTTIVTYGIVQAGEEYRDGIPYIRTGDIKNGSILTENLSRTDPEIAKKFKRSEVQTGDIVMSIRATVGTTALVPKILNGANLTQGTARIAVGENIEREYALYHLRCQATQNWIQKQVKGATFREITLGKLRELPVYLPPRDLQKKFVEIYNSIEMLKLNANKSLESSKQLFKSLQNQAFSGNL
ncbi:restriction endonuclease subunit S [Acinetobacter lwoffii]|uniref:restriction endonuclease subunit S n=1 Tax=Acinetobacter lwoffii TaxID=28090 RepID=UPI00209AC462|nr:restriction endonuclease subunit S [Acinetobacter lwoffii]UVB01991.1 Type I restriction-modification system, specificity subunit S [Acinetobacter lwoffii]